MPAVRPSVKLVRHTPAPEELVAAAAKLCYAADASSILDQEGRKASKFVEMLAQMRHLSPIEHASFTFLIEGVSRALTHQLVRHRIASYSQRSQRYVKHADFDYVVPPNLAGKTVKTADGASVDAVRYFEETMALVMLASSKPSATPAKPPTKTPATSSPTPARPRFSSP